MTQHQLELDLALFRLFQANKWEIYPRLPHWVIYSVPSEQGYNDLIERCGETLESEARKYLTFVQISTTQELVQITPNGEIMSNTTPFINAGSEILITPNILRVFDEIVNCSGGAGLVRLSDGLQLCLNDKSDCTLRGLATISEATKWKRKDYWNPEDLETFLRETQQQLEPNNPQSSIEFTYLTFDPKTGNFQNYDQRITSQYRLVEDGLGNLYHFGKNVDIESLD